MPLIAVKTFQPLPPIMKLFVALSCLAALAIAAPAEENSMSFWPEPSQRFTGRIINGQNAAQGAAPFICSMRWGITNMQHSCGGSILSAGWFLSAAHCITEVPNVGRLELQCGVTHRTNDVGQQQLRDFNRNTDAILHPGWVSGGVGPDDIVLIRVNQPFVLNANVQPVRQRRSGVVDSGVSRLFGWGAINSSQIAPTIPVMLQTAEKDLLSMAVCEARMRAVNPAFGDPLRPTNICAARGNISACGGDSGGPLVVSENGQWVQVGVVSWGISPCGNIFDIPSVYARSSAYIEWMASSTGMAVADFTA